MTDTYIYEEGQKCISCWHKDVCKWKNDFRSVLKSVKDLRRDVLRGVEDLVSIPDPVCCQYVFTLSPIGEAAREVPRSDQIIPTPKPRC